MGRHRLVWAAAGAAALAIAAFSVAVWAAPGHPRLADRSPGAIPVDVEIVLAVDESAQIGLTSFEYFTQDKQVDNE